MSKVYQSVRGVVQGTLRQRKRHFMVSPQPDENDGSLNDAIEQFERIFLDGIGKLKTAVAHDHAAVAKSAQDAEELIRTLKANITALEVKVTETEETVHQKEIASREVEESLRTEIRELQSAVTSKEEALAGRESEVQNFKSKTDVLVQRVSELESAVEQTKGEAAREVQRAEEVIETLKANISALEAKVKETEDTVHQKQIASREREESLSTEIRDLRVIAKSKEEALTSRESEVEDLKSKTDVLVQRVSELESALKQAKEEAANEAQHAEQVMAGLNAKVVTLQRELSQPAHAWEAPKNGTKHSKSQRLTNVPQQGTDSVVPDKQMKSAEDNPRAGLVQNFGVKPVVMEAGSQAVPHETVDHLTAQFSALQRKATDTVSGENRLETAEENPAAVQSQAAEVTPVIAEAPRETVSEENFDRIATEFSERANVIPRIASLIVRDHVRALGESMEKFPKMRLTTLLESLSKEIPDDKLKLDFCDRLADF